MSKQPTEPRAGLNPSLKTRTETLHDTSTSSPAPAESASVQRDEGRGWPIIWLVAAILCVLVAAWILFW